MTRSRRKGFQYLLRWCLFTTAISFLVLPVHAARQSAGSGEKSASLIEILMQLDSLQNEVRVLRNQVDVLEHELKTLKRRQRNLLLDMDKRIDRIERGGKSGGAPSVPKKTETKKPGPEAKKPPVKKAAIDPLQEQKDYDAAFDLMKRGHYKKAIAGFRGFIKKYPGSSLNGNAQYWVAEAHYVNRNFKTAISEYGKVLSRHPKNTKVSDATLKLGYSYYEIKSWNKARKFLLQAKQKYPGSRAAKLATQRLQKMKKEGH